MNTKEAEILDTWMEHAFAVHGISLLHLARTGEPVPVSCPVCESLHHQLSSTGKATR